MAKLTPEQNRNAVTVGQVWRDNKRGVTLIVNDIVNVDGVWKAACVRSGTGIESKIRLERLKSRRKADAKTGYTLLSDAVVSE